MVQLYTISCISYHIGQIRRINTLCPQDYIDSDHLRRIAEMGLQHVSVTEASLTDAALDVIEQLLKTSTLAPAEIDYVILATSPPLNDEEELGLIQGLVSLGVSNANMIALQRLHCSAFSKTLEIANAVLASGRLQNALVVISSKTACFSERVQPELSTVLGDGAVAFLVSKQAVGLKTLSSSTKLDSSAISPLDGTAAPARALAAYRGLRDVGRFVLRQSGVYPHQVSAMFCTAGNDAYLDIAAEAIGIDHMRVFRTPLMRFGHVLACDTVIAIALYLSEHKVSPGSYLLAIDWSQHIYGGVLLQVAR